MHETQKEMIFGTTVRIAKKRWDSLNDREVQVLWAMLDGLRNKEISTDLRLSPKQVEWYRGRVYDKLGSDSPAVISRMVALLEIEGLVSR